MHRRCAMQRLIALAPLTVLVAFASPTAPQVTRATNRAARAHRQVAPARSRPSTSTSSTRDSIVLSRVALSAHGPGARHRLVSWWRGNGNARDSVGSNNGVLQGAVTFGPGVSGRAFHFMKAGAFVRVPRTPALAPTTGVSIDFWVKGDPANAMTTCCQGLVTTDFYGVELSGGFSTRVGINFYVSTDNGASFHHTLDVVRGSFSIAPGRWVHVLGTYNGVVLKLYVNGRLYAQTPWRGLISPMRPTSFLSIGAEDGRTYNQALVGVRYFSGSIDEVKLYNYAIR